MNGPYAALAGRIRVALERVVQRANILTERAQQTNDDGYWDGVALNLHGFYGGVERIFEDIARTMGEGVPEGSVWHRDLLVQMEADVVGLRPPVIRTDTRNCLEAYRGFRHIVRNLYTFNLLPPRIMGLTTGLQACLADVEQDLVEFAGILERMSQGTD
ncbi:MAG: hypothetical protein GY759_20520 [Chloroflexi bacterium]|nr:hypothetical protein [Chloroflexota bacterium]